MYLTAFERQVPGLRQLAIGPVPGPQPIFRVITAVPVLQPQGAITPVRVVTILVPSTPVQCVTCVAADRCIPEAKQGSNQPPLQDISRWPDRNSPSLPTTPGAVASLQLVTAAQPLLQISQK